MRGKPTVNPRGCPRTWTDERVEELGQQLLAWMKGEHNFWLADFAEEHELWVQRLSEWAKEGRGGEVFADAYKRAKSIQQSKLIKQGLLDGKSSQMAIFLLKNVSDMTDRREVSHSGGVSVEIVTLGAPDEDNA